MHTPPRIRDLTIPALAGRARAGSLPCFAELVERFEGRLFNFLLRRAGSVADAEDLTQETFVRAWERIGQYNPRWQFSTWLFTIAGRLAIAHHRRRRRERTTGIRLHPATPDGEDPARATGDREQFHLLWDVADRVLNETQRAALWLRYAEDLSIKDIARVLDKTPVAVRVVLFRARERLGRQQGKGARTAPAGALRPQEIGNSTGLDENLAGELSC
ncbi:MAG: RNA polymerase sigma factor [Planctomycetota bacterium]